MTKLFAFGDSFVVGDQDDFGPTDCNYNPAFPPTHNMPYDVRIEYLKNNVSFAALLAKHYNFEFENFAIRGGGNFLQLDELLLLADQNKLNAGDVILFGISINSRDRLQMLEDHKNKHGIILDRLRADPNNFTLIEQFDFFWVLSVLETIKNKYNVKIIALNLFYNPIFKKSGFLNFNFNFLIGNNTDNNTMVDVLNDTYGIPSIKKHVYHTFADIPETSLQFYTWNKHPSALGHDKIKNWLVSYIDSNRLL